MLIRRKDVEVPLEAKTVPLGQKRKRGRPSKFFSHNILEGFQEQKKDREKKTSFQQKLPTIKITESFGDVKLHNIGDKGQAILTK
ncbi:hypothetical protein V9T40_007000 [Parthenolecanium corni]|uniref:Uncharacterized protein n=1 Tax=Parthenolecanium corni TaxID=536013 RepID=A0AAN9TWR0_9HEMI